MTLVTLAVAALVGHRRSVQAVELFHRVLILPFTVHSEKDLSFLQKGVNDMLVSRLTQPDRVAVVGREETAAMVAGVAGPLDVQTAISLARGADADHIILGSLTVFGDSVSTDIQCIDVNKGVAVVTFNQAGSSQGDVIGHVNRFAGQVNTQVFGRTPETGGAVTTAEAVPDSRRHPEKIWEESNQGALMYGSQSVEGQTASFAIWKSRKFPGAAKGVDVGDVDGDGVNEVVFVDDNTLYVYRYEDGRFARIVEIAQPGYYQHLGVDVADVNGNGTAEIYVTGKPSNSKSLASYVLEWNGKAFATILGADNRYYRAVEIPGRGRVLMGQARGDVSAVEDLATPFAGDVYALRWVNDRLEYGDRRLLPKGVNIYGWTVGDVLNNGTEMVAWFTERDFLQISDAEGRLEWESDERYGGSATYLEIRTNTHRGDGHKSEATTKDFVQQRLHVADMDGDGRNELIVVKNFDVTGQWLDQTRIFKSGHIEALSWDALGMAVRWRTQKTGYIPDYVVADIDNDGSKEMVFAVILKSGALGRNAQSYIASLSLQAKGS